MLAATFIISLFLNSADGVSAEAEKSLLTESIVNSQQNDFGAEASTFFWTIPNSQSDYDSEFIGAKLGVKYHLDSGTYPSSDNGVVDENLKVFGMDNLFICDGSGFPTSGNANSSFTTSALACRLADYLTKGR